MAYPEFIFDRSEKRKRYREEHTNELEMLRAMHERLFGDSGMISEEWREGWAVKADADATRVGNYLIKILPADVINMIILYMIDDCNCWGRCRCNFFRKLSFGHTRGYIRKLFPVECQEDRN